ncbi:MAG: DICT sensory domain-containing protein [Pyrinomonadaceae bacterium]
MNSFSLMQRGLSLAEEISPPIDFGTVANISRQDFDEQEALQFRTQVPAMEYLSLLIENAVLLRTNRSGRIYAGFQKLSRMEPIVDRYLRIADISERVYIFGIDDWTPPRHPHMKIVALKPTSTLSREWFVIAMSSNYHVALIAKDEDGFDLPALEARSFKGFKTSNKTTVQRLAEEVENLVDRSVAGK